MRSVPNEPLQIHYTSNGGLPDVALHVIGLQVIGDGPFQANLVYQNTNGIQRINLAQHSAKRRVRKIAESIARVGPFELAA